MYEISKLICNKTVFCHKNFNKNCFYMRVNKLVLYYSFKLFLLNNSLKKTIVKYTPSLVLALATKHVYAR